MTGAYATTAQPPQGEREVQIEREGGGRCMSLWDGFILRENNIKRKKRDGR